MFACRNYYPVDRVFVTSDESSGCSYTYPLCGMMNYLPNHFFIYF